MRLVAQVQMIGFLGKDSELSYDGAKARNRFSLGVHFPIKDEQGEWKEQTVWFECIAFGDERIFSKGQRIIVAGRLTVNPKNQKLGVVVESMEILAKEVIA